MNDITKARHYLKARQSELQHLTTFGHMLATAEQKYREILLKKQGNKEVVGTYDTKEIEYLLDMAALRHLKKYNQLPRNVVDAFGQSITTAEKKDLALVWLNT